MKAHIKEHPAWFGRFGAIWTPTVLVLAPDGEERWRVEGYLPRREIRAELEMGLARLAAVAKRWDDAQARYARIVDELGDTTRAPDALYWRYASEYNRTHDHHALEEAARDVPRRFPRSEAALKASVWAG